MRSPSPEPSGSRRSAVGTDLFKVFHVPDHRHPKEIRWVAQYRSVHNEISKYLVLRFVNPFDPNGFMQFVRAGMGFGAEFRRLGAEDLNSGNLVEILPRALTREMDVFAIHSANAPGGSPARLFVEYMTVRNWILEGGHFSRA